MKYYHLPAVMILTATAPVASAEATISLGYCMMCADFPKKKKKEASATFKKNMPTITPITSSNATFRSEFIPWPTKAMLQRTSPPISRELTHFFDFSTPLTEPLATSTKQRSVSSTRHKSTSQQGSKFDDIRKQQQHQQHNEEEPFFPLFLWLVAASLLAFNVLAAAAEFIFRYAEKEEKEDNISSDVKGEDFDCLGLAPTVEDEDDEEQEEDVSVCKVATIEIKRQDDMSRNKTLEKDSSVRQQEQDYTLASVSSVDNCLGYTCTNTFEDKVSVEILKFLLEDRAEKYDNVVMVEEEEEELCQDKVDNSSSAITESDEVDTIIAPPPKKKSVVGPWWDLFSQCNAAVDDESDDEQSMKSVLL